MEGMVGRAKLMLRKGLSHEIGFRPAQFVASLAQLVWDITALLEAY
jgi:hypothetical protein